MGNMHMTIDEAFDGTTEQESGFSRRTVVRAGAAAVWAVPAIQLATAAPALAASGPAALVSFSLTGSRGNGLNATKLTLNGAITNANTEPTQSASVALSLIPNQANKSFVGSSNVSFPGWTETSRQTIGDNKNGVRINLTPAQQVPG